MPPHCLRLFLTDSLWRGSLELVAIVLPAAYFLARGCFYGHGLGRCRARTGLLWVDIHFEVEEVVDWMPEILFTAEIAFGSQNRRVSQQELNLLQFSTIGVAEFRTSSTQIVRCDML